MKLLNLNLPERTVLATTTVLASGILTLLPWRLTGHPSSDAPPAGVVTNIFPLKLGSSIRLAVQSAGVAWKGEYL